MMPQKTWKLTLWTSLNPSTPTSTRRASRGPSWSPSTTRSPALVLRDLQKRKQPQEELSLPWLAVQRLDHCQWTHRQRNIGKTTTEIHIPGKQLQTLMRWKRQSETRDYKTTVYPDELLFSGEARLWTNQLRTNGVSFTSRGGRCDKMGGTKDRAPMYVTCSPCFTRSAMLGAQSEERIVRSQRHPCAVRDDSNAFKVTLRIYIYMYIYIYQRRIFL